MKHSIGNNFYNRLKYIFTLKHMKITLYFAAVLWVAVVSQMVINRLFTQEIQITEAFVKSDTEQMQSSLEILAEYNTKLLSAEEKEDIIYTLAESIGLVVDTDIETFEEDNRSEYYFYKRAKLAATELKVVTTEQQNYIIARINISEGIKSIERYKKLLENSLDKIGVLDKQVTLKYEGDREGNLTSKKKHEISEMLVNELQGRIAVEYDEGDIYTVYAYTGMLNEYVTYVENKVNIQIAITYNELTNKTKITLATPVLIENW